MKFDFWSDLASFFYLVPLEASYTSFHEVPDYIKTAIPYFILLVVLECVYGKLRGYRLYTVKDTIMSLSLGLVHQLLTLWAKEVSYLPYIYVYNETEAWRVKYFPSVFPLKDTTPSQSVLIFFLALLGCDLGYYFFHRYAHEYHMLWVSHSVHHSGERYNLATALRQGAWQFLTSWVFYIPMAVCGIPPAHFLRHTRLNTLYQFWIHTEVIGRLPWWIELIFNTPSHHRMHHRPPGNCNYAGVLIIWDRIFGTFCNECAMEKKSDDHHENDQVVVEDYKRGVIYGLAKPLNSYDPVYANIQHALRLCGESKNIFSRIGSLLSYTFRKRVDHPFRIATSPNEMFGDVLDDIAYTQKVLKAQGDNIVNYLLLLWARLFRLPEPVDEDNLDASKLKSNRDYQFIKGRIERENPPLQGPRLVIALGQFIITTVVILAMLATFDINRENDTKLDTFYKLAICLMCTFSLQYVRMHYSAEVPRDWVFK